MAEHRAISSLIKVQLFIAVVAISIVIVLALQIPPLIKTKQKLLDDITKIQDDYQQLVDKKNKLMTANENAKSELEKTEREISLTLDELRKIEKSPKLPKPAEEAIEKLISKISNVDNQVRKALADLKIPKTAPVAQTESRRQTLIGELFSDQSPVRLRAYDGLMSSYSADPQLVPDLLLFASKHRDNLNGIYNTLVVLSHLNKAQLEPHVTEIEAFAREVEPLGPKIKERVDKLLGRLPRNV